MGKYKINLKFSDNSEKTVDFTIPDGVGTYSTKFVDSEGNTINASGNITVGTEEKKYNLKFGLSDGSTIDAGTFKTKKIPAYIFAVSGGSRGYSVYVDVTAGANGASVTFGGVTKNVPANTTQTVSYTTPSSGQVTVIGSTAVCPGEITYTEDNKSKTERWKGITQVIRYDTTWTKVPDYFVTRQALTSIPQYVPGYLTLIGQSAFNGTTGIGSLRLEDGIIEIGNRAFQASDVKTSIMSTIPQSIQYIDDYAFYDCLNISGIIIPNLVKTIGNYAFGIISGSQSDASYPSRALVLNNVENIGNWAFYRNVFNSILVTNKIKSIGERAFLSCYLPSAPLQLPVSLTSIGEAAFGMCHGGGQYSETPPYLLEFKYAGTTSQWNSITKGEGWGDVSADAFDIICTNGVVTIK